VRILVLLSFPSLWSVLGADETGERYSVFSVNELRRCKMQTPKIKSKINLIGAVCWEIRLTDGAAFLLRILFQKNNAVYLCIVPFPSYRSSPEGSCRHTV